MYLTRYASYIKANLSQKPQCLPDAQRFSQMHSWYKHLSPIGTVFYAYLQRGQQARYTFDLHYDSKDQHQFHWHFVRAEDCSKAEIYLDDDHLLTGFSDDITVFFAKFPIVLNNNFGCGPLDHVNRYDDIERITTHIWNKLMKVTVKPPPTLCERRARSNIWGRQLLQHVKDRYSQAYKERDHQTVLTVIEKNAIPNIDTDVIKNIVRRRWEYYSVMGILNPRLVDALTTAIEQNQIGVIDIIEVFGNEGMVSDGARKMMQKIMGDEANGFIYMSCIDFENH